MLDILYIGSILEITIKLIFPPLSQIEDLCLYGFYIGSAQVWWDMSSRTRKPKKKRMRSAQ